MLDFFQYSDLCIKVTEWAKAYADGKSPVSDAVYDEEYKKLQLFERANPNEIDKDSPTQKVVSGGSDSYFKKVTHEIPMISIANSMSPEELREFSEDRASKGCSEQTIEFKFDGLASGLKYEDGELQDAVTRGDGVEGDSVLVNALQIDDIPKKISIKGKVEVRGEILWYKDDFKKWNDKLESLGKKTMANPRNGAAGTMKSHDPREVAERKLHFAAYSIVNGSPNDKHSDDLKLLEKEGFFVAEHHICQSTDNVMRGVEYMEKKKDSLPFLIDGLVIKVNDKTAYKRLGGTSKTPHYCTALKFLAEKKETDLLEIEESYGRSGAVTPVAIVKEVELSLTKVKRASLHNWDILDYLGLYKGCKVVMRKAGEIIPEIIQVVGIDRTKDDYEKFMNSGGDLKQAYDELHKKYNHEWYERPNICSHCNKELDYDRNRKGEQLVAWVCDNPSCSIKQFKNIVKFVSKSAMNIMDVGESVIEKLLSKGYIKDITDLYKVTKDQLLTLDSFGDSSADKFLKAIDNSKRNFMHQFLAGVGIPNLGKTASQILADHYGDLEAFHQAKEKELASIDGIGSELAGNIKDFRKDGGHRYLFRWFIDNKICTKAKAFKKSSDKLKGKVLIMTGKSDKISRGAFKDAVAENGGTLSSGITSKVNYVLFGDLAGPAKAKKISELQKSGHVIKKITDEEFLKMIE